MATESNQHFGNHTQYTPGYHFFATPVSVAYFAWTVRQLVVLPSVETAFGAVGGLAVVAILLMSRIQTLRVQDRVIRLEERLRLAHILPADLQSHIPTIRPGHLVAMRFASDEEVPDLMRQVIKNPDMKQKDIKRQIRKWNSDYFRA